MARKSDLRNQRENTVINNISKGQEKALDRALSSVKLKLVERFKGLKIHHVNSWKLADVVRDLREHFPDIDFHYFFETSAMKPDGGIMSIKDEHGRLYPILITEKKNQGTNDLRALEGKAKQAKGNAIERLGKNVIGVDCH